MNLKSIMATRRTFISTGAAGLLLAGCRGGSKSQQSNPNELPNPGGNADVILHIGPVLVDIAKDHTIRFNRWTINGKGFDEKDQPRALQKGKRYRLVFDNQTDDAHPVHLHRNSFELTNVYGKPTAGVLKDVVLVQGFKKIEVDVTPALDGLTLFHCHQQLHMDYGFRLLFNVV